MSRFHSPEFVRAKKHHRALVHLEHVRLAANHLAQRGVRGDHALVVQPEENGHGWGGSLVP